jgi:hypothetical protein
MQKALRYLREEKPNIYMAKNELENTLNHYLIETERPEDHEEDYKYERG